MAASAYYSVNAFGTGDIKTGSPTLTMSTGVATISAAQTDNIGIGCRVTYDTSKVAYISTFTSTTTFTLVTAIGATPSDEGSAVTVNSIAHEYADLAAACTGLSDANHTNNVSLTAADIQVTLPCYYDQSDDTFDETAANVTGLTVDSTRFVRIVVPTGGTDSANNQRHDGRPGAKRFRIDLSGVSAHTPITMNENYTEVIGVEAIHFGFTSGTRWGIGNSNGIDNCRVEACLVRDVVDGGATCYGIYSVNGCADWKIYNNVVNNMDAAVNTLGGIVTARTVACYNNTVNNCTTGFSELDGSNNGILINNVSYGNRTADYTGTYSASSDRNYSEDGTEPGTNGLSESVDADLPGFLDALGSDLRLASTSDLLGVGADNPSSGDFLNDINETVRTSTWSRGAWQNASVTDEILIDNQASNFGTAGSCTISSMVVAASTGMVVSITGTGVGLGITGVTEDGNAMTFLHRRQAESRTTEQWYTSAATSGTIDIVVSTDGSSTVHAHAITFTNHDTSDMTGSLGNATGNATDNPTMSLTMDNTKSWIVEHFFYNSVATTVETGRKGQTERSAVSSSYNSFMYLAKKDSADTVTEDYMLSNTKNWNILGVEINVDTGAVASARLPMALMGIGV